MAKEYYLVELDRPQDVSIKWVETYIEAAVELWSGQFHPESNEFDVFRDQDVKTQRATHLRMRKLLPEYQK